MKRGALDSFFKPAEPKKPKYEASAERSSHKSYPFPIPHLPSSLQAQLGFSPDAEGKAINDQPDLDLVYYQPYISTSITGGMFDFLRKELFFHRVQYQIKRGGIETTINTPRFTTVFGVDATSQFDDSGMLIDSKTKHKIEPARYKCTPRPIPQCLDQLRQITEGTTGETFNFCLVNYYADGNDSISYHSDDERFLGADPAIASFTLGARRDFLMKHKPVAPVEGQTPPEFRQIKMALGSGDMVLMRGKTQGNWLHSVPKRAGVEAGRGRINITFRRALAKGGTENYYQYNVGSGGVYRWDGGMKKMIAWTGSGGGKEERKKQSGKIRRHCHCRLIGDADLLVMAAKAVLVVNFYAQYSEEIVRAKLTCRQLVSQRCIPWRQSNYTRTIARAVAVVIEL